MTQYILGAETQIVTGGLEIAVLFPDAETVGSQGSAHISIWCKKEKKNGNWKLASIFKAAALKKKARSWTFFFFPV